MNDERRRFAIGVICFVILVLLAAVFVFLGYGVSTGRVRMPGNKKMTDTITEYPSLSMSGDKWMEGKITYKGASYRYNHSIRTYLIMGIDKDGKVEKAADYLSGGQSDAMFLLVTDDTNKAMTLIPINRNTMTKIRFCDAEGNYLWTATAQICLQHGYGDGLRDSCQKTTDAVSELFYDIPISGYVALNMDAMMVINRLAGGVEVEVMQDIEYPGKNVSLHKGEVKVLTDEEAYAYLRYRDINEFGTASIRLEREKQYLKALYTNLKKEVGGSRKKALDMYAELEEYMVTNIEFADIVDDLLSYGFDPDAIVDIPGELVQGKVYEEFYVDKEALYDIILSVLYLKEL